MEYACEIKTQHATLLNVLRVLKPRRSQTRYNQSTMAGVHQRTTSIHNRSLTLHPIPRPVWSSHRSQNAPPPRQIPVFPDALTAAQAVPPLFWTVVCMRWKGRDFLAMRRRLPFTAVRPESIRYRVRYRVPGVSHGGTKST